MEVISFCQLIIHLDQNKNNTYNASSKSWLKKFTIEKEIQEKY